MTRLQRVAILWLVSLDHGESAWDDVLVGASALLILLGVTRPRSVQYVWVALTDVGD